jgi:hypothetical protein
MFDENKFKELYEGKVESVLSIAIVFGISTRTVHKWAKKLNLKIRSEKKYEMPKSGETFNRLSFIKETTSSGGRKYWLCKCQCGVEKEFPYWGVYSGKTISCGCYQKEVTRKNHWTGHGEISGKYWSSLKHGAKCRQINFCVSIEEAWKLFEMQGGLCALSGAEIELSRMPDKCPQTASLDRIDNNVGYVSGNIQWLHKDVNSMKHSMSQEKFIELCAKVARYTGVWQDE